MKKKQIKGRLNFDKLTIAKLSKVHTIRGGSQNGSQYTEFCTDSEINCNTLTKIGPTTTGTRPTEEHTKCNCEINLNG